jgi:hypothetical protein
MDKLNYQKSSEKTLNFNHFNKNYFKKLSEEVRVLKTDNSRKDTLIKDLSKIK